MVDGGEVASPGSASVTEPVELEGDRAFEIRLETETKALRSLLVRMMRGRGVVDDLVQETLRRAWRYRASADRNRPLRHWLHKTALRVFLDHRDRTARQPELLGDAGDSLPARRIIPVDDLLDLEERLGQLSAVERDVLMRFHRDDQSLAEIAESLLMPLGTVKSHLHRARLRLLKSVQESIDEL